MKIYLSLNDHEFSKIEPWIEVTEWANPILGEYVFYNPSEKFRLLLQLNDIAYFIDNSEEDTK